MSQNFWINCIKVSTALAFMLLLQPALSQYNFTDLDKKLNQYQSRLGNNAVAMIYKDGKIIYQKEMGDFTANTQVQIASCSKWLTAALVMIFVDEGKLSLDDKVCFYLPAFKEHGKENITIRQCLCHETGIESPPLLRSIFEMSKYASLDEEVSDFAKHKMISAPGTAFRYSNIGLNIAARVLEVMSNKPFEELIREKIFIPLEMNNSSFESNKAINPSGGMRSTATDYMHFLMMILNKGVYVGKRILSEQSIAIMQESHTNLQMIAYAPKVAEGYNYALGEWVQEADENGKSLVVCCPGLFGAWPLVDLERGYACIFFIKNLLGEQKKDIYIELKKSIDERLPMMH